MDEHVTVLGDGIGRGGDLAAVHPPEQLLRNPDRPVARHPDACVDQHLRERQGDRGHRAGGGACRFAFLLQLRVLRADSICTSSSGVGGSICGGTPKLFFAPEAAIGAKICTSLRWPFVHVQSITATPLLAQVIVNVPELTVSSVARRS